MRPVVMTVAGSDSGGGAGIQADLRIISRNRGFGTTVITALTAQNLEGVSEVHEVPTSHVTAQLAAVLEGFPVAAAKTGMLWAAETIDLVAETAGQTQFPWVVDPVMVATSGAKLLKDDAIERYRRALIPRATLCTPNLDEAAVLLDQPSIADHDHEDAARTLAREYGVPFLVKGGHRSDALVDVLVIGDTLRRFPGERRAINTHGSGCALSAIIATELAHGRELEEAVARALVELQRAAAAPHRIRKDTELLGLEP